ncbi:MAG: hypothetical protein ABJE66_33250 [Deltaproteobacteria bacterium]
MLCIDARGTVGSVELLAATPAWLGETLVRDLRLASSASSRSTSSEITTIAEVVKGRCRSSCAL